MKTWHERMRDWRKLSHSHFEENACVEVGISPGAVGIRDAKQADQPAEMRPVLVFSAQAFAAFLERLASWG